MSYIYDLRGTSLLVSHKKMIVTKSLKMGRGSEEARGNYAEIVPIFQHVVIPIYDNTNLGKAS